MTTYAGLLTEVRNYTETDDTVLTDAILNDIILQAEIRIFREVDLDCFRSYQKTTLTQGNEFLSLPGQTPGTMAFVRTIDKHKAHQNTMPCGIKTQYILRLRQILLII